MKKMITCFAAAAILAGSAAIAQTAARRAHTQSSTGKSMDTKTSTTLSGSVTKTPAKKSTRPSGSAGTNTQVSK
jgi:Ni/Co efflux regulator RcnB